MDTTTTSAIEAAMVAAIHAITPTYEHERSQGWSHTPADRERGRPQIANTHLRCFDIVWYPRERGRSFLWYGNGEAYQCLVSVWASYKAVPPSLLDHMIVADGVDLMHAFAALPSTASGISHFEELGLDGDADDAANVVIQHKFRVHWAQDTDGF